MKLLILLSICVMSLQALAVPDIGFCDQYLRISEDLHCPMKMSGKNKNYFIDFGYKYCRKFIQANSEFSVDTQEKFNRIRNCLINELKENPQLTCQNSMSYGYKSHVPCYIDNGYCDMSLSDKWTIFKTTYHELIHKEYSQTAMSISKYCD